MPIPIAIPLVIAHRGASGYLPEHTLAAKAMAHAMGADFLEQDVVLTRDNVAIVLHDIHLDTVTDVAKVFPGRARSDGRYCAIDFDLAEIKQLTVRERVDHKTGDPVFPNRFPAQATTLTIPTLAEEIEFVGGLNKSTGRTAGIYPEIKRPAWHREQGKDISRIVVDLLSESGFDSKDDPIFLQCFDPTETKRIREELGCGLPLVQLIAKNEWNEADTDYGNMLTKEGLQEISSYADGVGPWMGYAIDESGKATDFVELAHQCGLVVHPFTFRADQLPAWASTFDDLVASFFAANIDGLFSDFPDKAIESIRISAARRII